MWNFGVINFDNKLINCDDLVEMGTKMIHRGPDDDGYYVNGSIGLGIRRLSIIDIKKGNQPITNEDETIWIVLNGEIYNYIELRKDLLKRGHKFKTDSDVECVVHLYEEMGHECIKYLNGMFSNIATKIKKKFGLLVTD